MSDLSFAARPSAREFPLVPGGPVYSRVLCSFESRKLARWRARSSTDARSAAPSPGHAGVEAGSARRAFDFSTTRRTGTGDQRRPTNINSPSYLQFADEPQVESEPMSW